MLLAAVAVGLAYAAWYLTGAPAAPDPGRLVAWVTPPHGTWDLLELSGSIDVEAGGTAVLCQQGRAQRRALTQATGFASRLQLSGGEEEGALEFEIGFRRGADVDRFTNRGGVPIPAQGQHPVGTPAQAVRHGTWSWKERKLSAGVGSRSDPSDTSGSSPEVSLEITGTFDSATVATGTWSFREVAGLGACWSRAEGSGTWRAVAREAPVAAPSPSTTPEAQ